MGPEGAAAPASKPRRDETLVKALVCAHRWRHRIESGQARSITDLAEQEGVTAAYVCRLLPLTCLAPDLVEAILDGRQPKGAQARRDAGERAARLESAAFTMAFLRGSAGLSERPALGVSLSPSDLTWQHRP